MKNKFLWGASESGFQFEMGDESKRNIDPNTDWWVWVHDKDNIEKGIVSGDLPENGINYWDLYEKDHNLAKEIGMNAYRIGIEWSRIFPEPTFSIAVDVKRDENDIITEINVDLEAIDRLHSFANQYALAHYRDIIMDLRKKGMKVFVCLNHFTLPLWIHDPIKAKKTNLEDGPLGWADSKTVIEFVKYAAYVAWRLGDLVDMWCLFNEPLVVAELGYLLSDTGFPPGVSSPEGYISVQMNLINAHVRGYDVIKKWDTKKADEDSPSPAEVGLIHNVIPPYPLDPNNEKDIKAAEHFNYLRNELILNAITKGEVDIDFNGEIDSDEIFPSFKNKLDWLGINYYTRVVIKHSEKLFFEASELTDFEMVKGYGHECPPQEKSKAGLPTTDFGWEIYPEGLRDIVKRLSKYRLPMYITENGIADAEDKLRPMYLIEHLKQVDKLINEDKVDLRGYFTWALTDNYEWASGFKMKFGLFEVDLDTKERIKRKSADIFKEIATAGSVTEEIEKKYL
ncbi:MAG: beta-galactosidase BgaS [Candidatus Asgardarchaeia archaeon]